MTPRCILTFLVAVGFLASLGSAPAETIESCPCDGTDETVVIHTCEESATLAGSLSDNVVSRFLHSVCRDMKRNNCWPEPFVCDDRESVRTPFVRMVSKGWQRQNTLGEHDFVPETGELTLAARARVRQILLLGLPQHRTIYVHRSLSPSETLARVDAVQQLAARTVRQGELPEILETDLPAPGWSAGQVDAVERKFIASMPMPRLTDEKEETSASP